MAAWDSEAEADGVDVLLGSQTVAVGEALGVAATEAAGVVTGDADGEASR